MLRPEVQNCSARFAVSIGEPNAKAPSLLSRVSLETLTYDFALENQSTTSLLG